MSPPSFQRQFSGRDYLSSSIALVCSLWIFTGGISIRVVAAFMCWVALALTFRYRLRISTNGIEVCWLLAWFLPVIRRRYPLTADLEEYEAWEDDVPQCIVVVYEGKTSTGFGPSPRAIGNLYREASAALREARARLGVKSHHVVG